MDVAKDDDGLEYKGGSRGALFTMPSAVRCRPEFQLVSNQRRGMGEFLDADWI